MLTKNPNKVYEVRLVNKEKGLDATIEVQENENILDAAIDQGVNLAYSCYAGACTSCTCKLLRGLVKQDGFFLRKKEEEAGFLLLCKTYPKSDCTILTDQEDALLDI